MLVLANKADVKGSASTTEVHDRICRAEGSPLGSGAPSTVLTSGGAAAESGATVGSGSGPGYAGGSGKREYRVFTCSALRGDGVRESVDWIVTTAKRHMYTHARD